ncbi:MAG: tetratricopeptide repeat protein [Cyanobacteria bacterium TGS_CYA1]|nr:tetratricopeptide repeat protein [Cyanobacteria bacterium TGS_CYA1]
MRTQKIVPQTLLAFALGLSFSIAPQESFAAAKTIDKELAESLEKGYNQLAKGDYSKAVEVLSAAVKQDPDSVTARRYLAYALVKQGNSLAAIDQLNAITRLTKPTYFEWCTYGEAYLKANSLDQAASCYKAAISLAPKADYAKSGLIRVSMQGKKYEEAMNLAKDGMKEAANPQIYEYYKKLYSGVLAASAAPQIGGPVQGATVASGTPTTTITSSANQTGNLPGAVSPETMLKRITSQQTRPVENHPGG